MRMSCVFCVDRGSDVMMKCICPPHARSIAPGHWHVDCATTDLLVALPLHSADNPMPIVS